MFWMVVGIIIGVMLHRKYVRQLVHELEAKKLEIDLNAKKVEANGPTTPSSSF